MTPYYTDLTKLVEVYTNVQSNSADWETAYQSVSGDLTLNNVNVVPGSTLSESVSGLTVTINGQQYIIPLLPI